MHAFSYRAGALLCEEVSLADAAAEFGTPLYLYSAGTIRDHYQRFDQALAPLDHLVCYAVKANPNGAILRLLAKAGAGFDIVSGGELSRVLAAGADPGKCTFAGVGKTRAEIETALEHGVFCFNVESEGELDHINEIAVTQRRRAPIALRVNPDVAASTHAYISTGRSEDKFGIPLEDAASVYHRAAQMSGIEIRGVQMHIGSQITEVGPFVAAIEKVAGLIAELRGRYPLEFFSIGGGLGIAYHSSLASGESDWWRHQDPPPLTLEAYAAAITPLLTKIGLRVLFEPGRLLVGNAGVLLTRVLYLKDTGSKKFAIVDAGMNDLLRPALYGSYHEIVPVQPRPSHLVKIDIVGPVCESGDFFAHEREMPELRPGDLLALMSAGAYGYAMASNYNSRPLPAEAMVDGARLKLIGRRQQWTDLTALEVASD
ncbi:MAG: diaminopimelate decarboxylase [Verrucomicrobiota bacterium]